MWRADGCLPDFQLVPVFAGNAAFRQGRLFPGAVAVGGVQVFFRADGGTQRAKPFDFVFHNIAGLEEPGGGIPFADGLADGAAAHRAAAQNVTRRYPAVP